MKILSALFLSVALLTAPVAITGCKTQSTQQVAYKTLKSVQQASVAALNIYGAAYRRGEIDIATRAKVQSLYTKYQAAFNTAVTAARFDYNAPSTPDLTAALVELVNLVNTLRK